MDTYLDRRTRRRARRRSVTAVGVTCVLGIALSILAASCATVTSARDARAPGPVVDRWRAIPARMTRAAPAVPTTTTTTRPAVNPETGPPPANTGLGRRIIYCNSCQTVWIVESDEFVTAKYKVSGHTGMPNPGEYHVFRKLDMGRSKSHPDLRLPWFVGFAWGNTTDIGFHGIPLRPDGSQIEDDSQLGVPLSSGCVRENQVIAKFLYDWAAEGTLVVVTG